VTEPGTPFSVQNMNNIEDGIENAHETLAAQEQSLNAETAARRLGDEALQIIADHIMGLIPNQANIENLLADKNFVNSTVSNVAAWFLTPDSLGDFQWASLEALRAGPWYSGGTPKQPTQNDYAVFINHDPVLGSVNSVWRALFSDGLWSPQYKINDTPFTAAQTAALNSNITAALVEKLANPETIPTENSAGLITSGGIFAWFGAHINTLKTAAKNIIGAINELFDSKIDKTEKGKVNGVATLGSDGILAQNQRPSASDVLEGSFLTGLITYNVSDAAAWAAVINTINENLTLYQNAEIMIMLSANITVDFNLTVPEGVKKLTIRNESLTSTTVRIITRSGNSDIKGHAGCDLDISYVRLTAASSVKTLNFTNFNSVYLREYMSNAYTALTLSNINRLELASYISLTSSGTITLENIPHVSCAYSGVVFQGASFTAKNCNFYLTQAAAGLSSAAAQSINNCPVFKENDLQVTIAAPSASDVQATPAARGLTALAQIFANNIKHLMGNIYTAKTDAYNTTFTIPLGYESAKILAITLLTASSVNTSITINFRTAFAGSYVLFRADVSSVSVFNGSSITFSSMNSSNEALVIFFRN